MNENGAENNQSSKDDDIPETVKDVHLKEGISTKINSFDQAKLFLAHSGQFNNEKIMDELAKYLIENNQSIKDTDKSKDRRYVASCLSQIVLFNERSNPVLAEKMRKVLLAFIS